MAISKMVFMRRPEVERVTGLSTSTLYDLMARQKFPKPVPITKGRVAWVEDEIIAWQKAKIEQRDSAAA